jgi:hypothetical protein
MNYDQFFEEAAKRKLHLSAPEQPSDYRSTLDNEALFQLPLLAMVILTLAKGNSKPRMAELGQLVSECLERTIAGFKGSSQDIGWSANLRIRTVKALTFLERTGLAQVDERTNLVMATSAGRKVIESVAENDTLLSHAVMTLERSHENIKAEKRIRSEV